MEKALISKGRSTKSLKLLPHEINSVESKMIRYKYGPWDFRYKRFINVLIGRQLAQYRVDGKIISIGLTEKGRQLFESIKEDPIFEDLFRRSKILRSHFDLTRN